MVGQGREGDVHDMIDPRGSEEYLLVPWPRWTLLPLEATVP